MIYLDNAATSYPKPKNVLLSVMPSVNNYSFNSGRGGYTQSLASAEKIYSVRERVGEFFGFSPQNVVFTKNCTEALNMAIKGSVKKGEHIIEDDITKKSTHGIVIRADMVATTPVIKDKGDKLERSLVRHDSKKLDRELNKIFYSESSVLGKLFKRFFSYYKD